MSICFGEKCGCSMYPFLDYVEKGMNKEARSALQNKDEIDEWATPSGCTLLHFSVKYGNAEMTQYLINKGCNVNAQEDSAGQTPLMLAIKAKDLGNVEILIENNADIYLTNISGMSSLQLAFYWRFNPPIFPLKQKSHSILEILFDEVNKSFLKGTLMQYLLNANDSVKFAVVVFGNAEVTRFIVENGYPIDFHDPFLQFTALHCTIRLGRFECAKTLIECGASLNTFDEHGRSPLRYYTQGFENVDENCEVLKKFLKYSTVFSVPDGDGFTDIDFLLVWATEKTIKTILLSDVDVDACLGNDRSILGHLVTNKNFDNFDFLTELDIKLDVNKRIMDGNTSLTLAAKYGCPKKVEFLLKHGADVNCNSSVGSSPLSKAINGRSIRNKSEEENDRAQIIELLLQYGADAQSFFSDSPREIDCVSLPIKVIIAQLAVLEALDQTSLANSSRDRIKSEPMTKIHFDLCRQQLEEMKAFKFYATVTLFDLLTAREEKIVAYARNQELASSMSIAVEENMFDYEAYYINTLQKRFTKGQEVAELQGKAAQTIETLTGLYTEVYHSILYKIISYLDRQDLHNLWQMNTLRVEQ